MPSLIESVPNFSEGRDSAILDSLTRAIRSIAPAHLLDRHADPFHHRSVFTVVGPPDAVLEAVFRATQVAVDRIDLRSHQGEHPRMGAADVIPLVPLRGATVEICIEVANRLADGIGALGVPVFLYGFAARKTGRMHLPAIRRPQFEGLAQRIANDAQWAPDAGPKRLHPTAGATAVGVRPLLVAYNVFLDTSDVSIAKAIARAIRTSSGGLPALQARGFSVAGRAQVSMNLLDVDVTPPVLAFEAVRREARARRVTVAKSEVVGLLPERAVPPEPEQTLLLTEPIERHVLERRLEEVYGEVGV